MVNKAPWRAAPPDLPASVLDCLTEPASLSLRLQAGGHRFAVQVLEQGASQTQPDEAVLLGLPAGAPVYARHVALTLNDVPVVYARSAIHRDCPAWLPVLARGSRSLGLTLFGELPELRREPLLYQMLASGHPLARSAAAIEAGAAYPARRCRFLLNDAPLLLTELFLPALKDFL
ncbi:chorismate lyase [Chromobacterium sp. IIBBL 290-4]|uniref:chorismate--pyruvate lyase family protein n=1 Tax=Chromobacterium sp. IIBBL 290-4 TaxID=2953890 RepID=UPI0020B718E8|nr:chorismate lyase [Chromobacterium sp. IIBBL 290-4]UTH72487.1 chorismate lyase [Chromobacterium sp. IIBBL 290-4]